LLTLPAFLSSLPLQGIILSNVVLQPDSHFASYLSHWSAIFGSPPPDQSLSGKQSHWDRPEILADKAMVESCSSNEQKKASFLTALTPHSGDWLLALPITACGLRLDDEAVHTAVALKIGHDSLCPSHMSMRSSG